MEIIICKSFRKVTDKLLKDSQPNIRTYNLTLKLEFSYLSSNACFEYLHPTKF